jgi:pimeloyl-ACP methyl ester carboxylesterase
MVSRVLDAGTGDPLLVLPGIQGRWEWLAPAIRSLAARYHVSTFSLPADADAASQFDAWMADIDAVLDRHRVPAAVIVGVSYGGLIAVRYAAKRSSRVRALVLVSTPAPRVSLDPASMSYLRHPRLALPAFAARGVRRLVRETLTAREGWRSRLAFLASYGGRALRYPLSPPHMAHWVRAWQAADIEGDCHHVTAPTLVITGERDLDRVVRVGDTLQYVQLIRGARHETLARTGHVGLVSRPDAFAGIVFDFLDGVAAESPSRVRHA